MDFVATARGKLGQWLESRGAKLRLCARVTVAALLTLALVHVLNLSQAFWAVLTAVIVMQASLGGSIKAAIERFIGTLAGAVYGGAVAYFVPHSHLVALGLALAIAVAPLAFAAASHPSFRVAPMTAIVVLLSPTGQNVSPIEFTVDRVIEISVGSVVGLAVALLVLPARAHTLVAEASSRIIALFAQLLPLLLDGLGRPTDNARTHELYRSIRKALARLETVVDEAKRERSSHLTEEPDPDPLLRTCLRLRHDLVMIGRASSEPLPELIYHRLAASLSRVSQTAASYVQDAGAALLGRKNPPSLAAFEAALERYAENIAGLRREHLTQDLPVDAVGRVFSVGFMLEQLRQDFRDLRDRIAEFARSPPEQPADGASRSEAYFRQ